MSIRREKLFRKLFRRKLLSDDNSNEINEEAGSRAGFFQTNLFPEIYYIEALRSNFNLNSSKIALSPMSAKNDFEP